MSDEYSEQLISAFHAATMAARAQVNREDSLEQKIRFLALAAFNAGVEHNTVLTVDGVDAAVKISNDYANWTNEKIDEICKEVKEWVGI